MYRYFLLFVFCLSVSLAMAQPKPKFKTHWKDRVDKAEEYYRMGNFSKAGWEFNRAWKEKKKKLDLVFKAGECYYKARDYQKAARAYKYVKNNNDFPKAGFQYAQSLKKAGKHEDAIREFVLFISNYRGGDFQSMSAKVEKEKKGCELALQTEGQKSTLKVEHLAGDINSDVTEFAPIPFSDDIIYFSSNVEGAAKVYRAQRKDGKWGNPTVPKIFTKIEQTHFGNGSFSPDNKRFYFTQCEDKKKTFGVHCQLYVMEHKGGFWNTPEKLPAYINEDNVNVTHPHVTVKDGKEILYFSSDKKDNSRGGYDIWYVTRDYKSKELNFSLPANLGPKINTPGDEATPFYDNNEGILYFSSDGHVTLGGKDIYKTSGNMKIWSAPENLGQPINSSADDLFYVKKPWKNGGYFVSNRLFGAEKTSNQDDDIFQFEEAEERIMVAGNILAQGSREEKVSDVKLSLYEIMKGGQKRLLNTRTFEAGQYSFDLIPNKKYKVEAEKEGYNSAFFDLDVKGNASAYKKNLELEKKLIVASTTAKSPSRSAEITPKPENPVSSKVTRPKIEAKPVVPTVAATPKVTAPTTSRPVYTPPPATTAPKPVVKTTPVYTNTASSKPPVTTSAPSTIRSYPRGVYSEGSKTYTYKPNTVTAKTKGKYYTSSDTGVFWKVQVKAVKTFKYRHYTDLEPVGEIEQEYTDSGLTRVMVGRFPNKSAAIKARTQAREIGYDRAYLVKYAYGKRIIVK